MAKKKKDPEAPYSDNPTPGKPGWNIAGKRASKKKDGLKSCGRDMQGTQLVRYNGKCMHPNEIKRLKSRESFTG